MTRSQCVVSVGLVVILLGIVGASLASATQSPYGGSPWPVPGQVEAEDYDVGGEGTSYHDLSEGNGGGVYRSDDVDIYGSAETRYNVGYIQSGEWLEYTIDVDHDGWYDVSLSVATQYNSRCLSIKVDGELVTGVVGVPRTGAGDTYETMVVEDVPLPEGEHVLCIDLGNGGYNLDWISFAACPQWPYGSVAWPIPGQIEAEDYDMGGEGTAYHDTSVGNPSGVYRQDDVDLYGNAATRYVVGNIATDEWLEYTVLVDHDGWYDVELSAATPYTSRHVHIEFDGEDVTGRIDLPQTGSYDSYETASLKNVPLEAGQYTMLLAMDINAFNVDWVKFTALAQYPYGLEAHAVPGRIEAEDYDVGGEGVAYHDTTAGNNGGYRSDDVDIPADDGGYVVGYTSAGEWLEYTIDVDHDGLYNLSLRASCAYDGRYFHIEVDGEDATGYINLPNTGSETTYQTISVDPVALTEGIHVMRIALNTGNSRINWVEFSACTQWPYKLVPLPIPGTIQAEDYDGGGEGYAYHDSTSGNGPGKYRDDDVDISSISASEYVVSAITTDEWLEYTVNVDHAGLYDLEIRAASPYDARYVHIEIDGEDVTGQIDLPNTGAYDDYETVQVTDIELPAGEHIMRLALDRNAYNIDWMKFTTPAAPALTVSASDTLIEPGDTVNFSLSVSGGTAPYTYAWDFGTPPCNAKVGTWDHDKLALAYSTDQNPSHTFVYAGVFEVWVTVEDHAGMKTRAFLEIDCSEGATVLDAVDDIKLDEEGGDNANKLALYLNSYAGTEKKLKVLFSSGTYRFSQTNQFMDGSPTDYRYVWLEAAEGADVTFVFDPQYKNDGVQDVLFCGKFYGSSTKALVIRNITIQYDLDEGDEPKDVDQSRVHYSGGDHYVVLQKTTIRDFSSCFADTKASIYRSNLLDWQGQYHVDWPDSGRSSCVYGSQNMMLRENYLKSGYDNHSHLVYSSGDREYVYLVGNWGDQTNAYSGAVGYRHQGSGGGLVKHRYCYRNVAKNVPLHAFYIGGGDVTGARARNIDVIDNVADGCGDIQLLNTEPNVDAQVKFCYNHIQNTKGVGIQFGSASTEPIDDIYLTGNVLGWNAPCGTCWSFVSSDCSGSDETDINPSGDWLAEVGDNVANRSKVDTSDPGTWEFVRPSAGTFTINNDDATTASSTVTLNISVTDAGSGMGSAPRWPFLDGALMQFSNDGATWSEVRPYGATASWTLSAGTGTKTVYARFRDVDGNWSDVEEDTIVVQ